MIRTIDTLFHLHFTLTPFCLPHARVPISLCGAHHNNFPTWVFHEQRIFPFCPCTQINSYEGTHWSACDCHFRYSTSSTRIRRRGTVYDRICIFSTLPLPYQYDPTLSVFLNELFVPVTLCLGWCGSSMNLSALAPVLDSCCPFFVYEQEGTLKNCTDQPFVRSPGPL